MLAGRPVKLACVPTTISAMEMTNVVPSNALQGHLVIRNDLLKPALVLYDSALLGGMSRADMIKGAFLLLAHLTDMLYEGISPLTMLMAKECLRVLVRMLMGWASDADADQPVEDLLYAAFLVGECWNRSSTHLHHHLVDLLHQQYELPYDDCHIALHAYSAWYNHAHLLTFVQEELGTLDLGNFIYEMQYQLLPQRLSLLLMGLAPTSLPSILSAVMSAQVRNPSPLETDRLTTAMGLALVGARPSAVDKPLLTMHNSIAVVLDRFQSCPDGRLKAVMMRVVQAVHGLIRETKITQEEWAMTIAFLTRVGQTCSSARQEMVQLADVLGVEALIRDMEYRQHLTAAPHLTPGSLLGPFHFPDAPVLGNGEDMFDQKSSQDEMIWRFSGHVLDDDQPIAGAVLDVWHSDDQGYYDVQSAFHKEESKIGFRAKFITDARGAWAFRTLPVQSYMLPQDGPVGDLVQALHQHTWLPAHVHFIVTAKGYRPLITHLYPRPDDPYLQDDSGFAHKPELVKEGVLSEDGQELLFQQDFVLCKDTAYDDLDPLHYVPSASAGLFFAHKHRIGDNI